MSKVWIPGSKPFDSQILIHSCTQKYDVSMAKKLLKHLSKEHLDCRVIYQGKYRKRSSKRKFTYIEYHV